MGRRFELGPALVLGVAGMLIPPGMVVQGIAHLPRSSATCASGGVDVWGSPGG
jgi:hypothetical protein